MFNCIGSHADGAGSASPAHIIFLRTGDIVRHAGAVGKPEGTGAS
jgi:hypothetical protein